MNDKIREISRKSKFELAQMHVANGGIMGLATYLKWRKDELVNAVLEDMGIDPWSA